MFVERRNKLMESVDQSTDAVVLFNYENGKDLEKLIYYFTGFNGSLGVLVITRDQPALLIADPRYQPEFDRICASDGQLRQGDYFKIKDQATEILGKLKKTSEVGFLSNSTYFEYERIKNWSGGRKLVNIDQQVSEITQIKQPDEVAAIEQACDITRQVLKEIPDMLKPGISEQRLILEIEYLLKKRGATGIAFPTIVAAGVNSAQAHWRGSDYKIQDGDMVVVDLGAEYKGYGSDFCQTFIVGKGSKRVKDMIDTVCQVQQSVVADAKPGAIISDLGKKCEKQLAEAGYSPDMGHALGHGVGLSVHEDPHIGSNSPGELKEGMCIALEPGVYIPGFGGTRHETTLIVK